MSRKKNIQPLISFAFFFSYFTYEVIKKQFQKIKDKKGMSATFSIKKLKKKISSRAKE